MTSRDDKAKAAARPDDRGYHHGDLRAVLIATAEELLLERGANGFTLRECARRAGVSPSAPAHHFGNMAGLLEAIATLGFNELHEDMLAAAAAGPQDHAARLVAMAKSYIRFAVQRPGRFRVTFQSAMRPLESKDPELAAAAEQGFALVKAEVEAITGKSPSLPETVFLWSFVHGLANLLLDKQLSFLEDASETEIEDPDSLPSQVIAILGGWVRVVSAGKHTHIGP